VPSVVLNTAAQSHVKDTKYKNIARSSTRSQGAELYTAATSSLTNHAPLFVHLLLSLVKIRKEVFVFASCSSKSNVSQFDNVEKWQQISESVPVGKKKTGSALPVVI
jgi:hypothetical protein